MSPLEAKNYGLIDHVVGGDEAVFKVEGSTRAFPKTKEQYVNWGDDDMLGADGSRGSRCGRAWVGCALGACWERWGGGWWGRRVCEAGLCHSVIVRCCLRVILERQGRVRAGQSWAARPSPPALPPAFGLLAATHLAACLPPPSRLPAGLSSPWSPTRKRCPTELQQGQWSQ
jgi:hypothetical protein